MNKLVLLTPFLLLMLMGIASASPTSIPSGIQYYVPINLTNSQSTATASPFQQMVNITESTYSSYIAYSGSTANFEYFYSNGTIIPAWIESNSSGKLITWVKTVSIPASSKITIYLGSVAKTTNLLSSSGTSGIGEAPQLSATYGEYDDGANVFQLYQNFAGTTVPTGWTGSATDVTINNGATVAFGGYLTTSALYGLNASQILDFGFTAPTANAGDAWYQIGYVSQSGGFTYEPSTSIAWSTNDAPPSLATGIGTSASSIDFATGTAPAGTFNVGTVYWGASTSSSGWIDYGSKITSTTDVPTAQLYVGINNNQADGSAPPVSTLYWLRIRAYPPSGVMPSVSFGAVLRPLSLTISPNPATYGQAVTITATCPVSTDTCAIDYPSLGTAIATGTGSATYTYTAFSLAAGTYSSFYANDTTQGTNSTSQKLTINKNSTYTFTLTSCGAQVYPYSCNTTAKITTHKNQLSASLYLNSKLLGNTTTTISNLQNGTIGSYSYIFNTTGNTNYTSKSTTANFLSYIPINIYYANSTTSEIHKKLNTSGLYLIPKCTNNAASLSLGYCIGNIAYSTSTTLSGNIYVFGNITIDSGVTITENGHYLYATETFTNDGTITGGNNTNAPGGAGGEPGGSGTSITTSYAGSGAGGAEGGCVYNGGSGGSTLAAGGVGGSGTTGAAGGSGSTPSAPTMSQSLAIDMLNNITKYLSSASGGGGATCTGGGGIGAEGVFGVVIGGNKVIAGTISVNGNSGNGGGSAGSNGGAGGGGGGGSGAASILVIYNASYTAGTYSYTGGSGGPGGTGTTGNGGNGGTGGNGQLITYKNQLEISPPSPSYYYPLKYNATTPSNMINFNVSITNLDINSKSYQSSNQSLLYTPNQSLGYLLSFREQQGTAKVYLNTTFLLNTTTINSDFNFSSLFQYFPILAHTPTWTAKPSSWSIVVANEPITNQQKNTTKGEQFDSPNLAVSFANAIKLTYPFTSSFYLNLTDNPKVQKNITLAKISVIPSATTPAAPTTRKIAFTNSYAAINGTLISPSTASFTAQALFNNYTFTIANNFNISTTNGISEYMQDSNYQNPTISLSNISLAGIKTNYFKTYNNFCPVTIGSNYSTFNQYFVDQAGEDVQYSVLQGSGYGAVGYYMIFQSQYNGSLEQVGSYKITSASPFDYPTEIENAYKFIFLSPNCQKLIYQTPLSLISSPYSITIPITANITLAPELRLNATCTTLNATAIRCSGAGYGPTIHFFTISIYNQSGVFGSTNKVIKQVVINASSYVKIITGLNTSENLKVVSSVNFGDPLNTTISTYYTQFQVHILNLYGMLGPIAMIIMLALMGMFIDGKALPFIGAPIILFVLWAFNIISLTLTYIVGFIIIAVIIIVLMSRDYK